MRLVVLGPVGLEIRWTWLPYWIGSNSAVVERLNQELRDELLASPEATDKDMHLWLCVRLEMMFPAFEGLTDWLNSIQSIQGP